MFVKVIRGRMGDPICRFNGTLTGLFDRSRPAPEIGQEIDVMLCAPVWPKNADDQIRTFIVQPVTDRHILVKHFGFKISGDRRFVTAPLHVRSIKDLEREVGGRFTPECVTPGRTPVNEGPVHAREGEAYVLIDDIVRECPRICGVPQLDGISHQVKERFPLAIC